MAEDKKVSSLPSAANVAVTDKILVVRNPNTSSVSLRLVNFSTLAANLVIQNTVPASSSANGLAGTLARDSNYLYICTSNNYWKRIELQSF